MVDVEWSFSRSDGHGFVGMGHAGTGAGDQIVTRDIPVPIWAGDGYVTGS